MPVGLASGLLLAPAGLLAQSLPSRDAVAQLVRELDRAFSDGDAERYLAPFDPVHAVMHARFAARVREVLSSGVPLVRRSAVERFWHLGGHGIALIVAETSAPGLSDREPVQENSVWALRDESGQLRIVLAADVSASALAVLPREDLPLQPEQQIRCDACNYTIRASDDWLMVPNCSQRLGCLESFSFYSLSLDLAADLSVHVAHAESGQSPAAQLRRFVKRGEGVDSADVAIEPWLPPMYAAGNRPMYLDGARCVLEDHPNPGDRAELHLATYGRLSYLITVRGSAAHIDANRPAVRSLLQSFALDDPRLEPAVLVERIAGERQGGSFDGPVYENHKTGVRFAGPAGWATRLDASFCAFDVAWAKPDGTASLRLTALLPSQGIEHWTERAADAALRAAWSKAGVEIVDAGGWRDGERGFAKLRLVEARSSGSAGAARSLMKVGFDRDLLVLLELSANDAATAAGLRALLDGLSRDD